MTAAAIRRNEAELKVIKAIAESGEDSPVLMLNLNYYAPGAAYPDGDLYLRYMSALHALLPRVGAKILWQTPVHGQAVGAQPLHEILAAWYPTHQAFLDLRSAPGADENFRLRGLCVETAVIHRCASGSYPIAP